MNGARNGGSGTLFRLSAGSLLALTFAAALWTGCGRKEKSSATTEELAKVGKRTVGVQEFVRRAEFSARPPGIPRNPEKGKRALLDLLVAEKLMANEAERRGLDRDPLLQKLVASVEARAVVRELYKDEVRAQVEVREAELRRAYARSQTTLLLRYLRTDDRRRAERWHQELERGRSFRDVLAEAVGGPVDDSTQVATLRWGENDPALEDTAYELKTPGQISPVVKSRGLYYILQLVDASVNPLVTESDFASRRRSLEKVIRARKESARSAEFVGDFMRDKHVVLKGAAFAILARGLERFVDFEPQNRQSLKPKFDTLTEIEFNQAQEQLAAHLDDPLITFRGGRWTLRQALDKMWLAGMPLDRRSHAAFTSSLQQLLKNMVRDEFLAREGYRRGLQKRASVRQEVQMWRDHYLYLMLRQQLIETDGQKDLRPFVEELKQKYAVRVNGDRLAGIRLTRIHMMAVRPGYLSELVVPTWPRLVEGNRE